MKGYTAFSDDPYEQEGYYLALHITYPGNNNIRVRSTTTDAEHGDSYSYANLDSDGIIVMSITILPGGEVKTKTIDVFVRDNNNQPILTKTYTINCESSGEPMS